MKTFDGVGRNQLSDGLSEKENHGVEPIMQVIRTRVFTRYCFLCGAISCGLPAALVAETIKMADRLSPCAPCRYSVRLMKICPGDPSRGRAGPGSSAARKALAAGAIALRPTSTSGNQSENVS